MSCAVNLLTNSMGVEGSASPEEIIRAVESAGYGASPADPADVCLDGAHALELAAAAVS